MVQINMCKWPLHTRYVFVFVSLYVGGSGGDNIAEKKGVREDARLCNSDMRPLYATLITRQDIGLASFSL